MVRFSLGLALATAFVVVLVSSAGLPSAGQARASPSLPTSPPRAGSLSTDAVAVPRGGAVVPLSSGFPVTLTFTLRPSHPAALARFAAAVNDPASPLYRHFLTPAQYESEFSPSALSLHTVVAALEAARASSLTVTPDRSGLTATLPASAAGALLGVHFVSFGRVGSEPLYTTSGTVRLPGALGSIVSAVDGLSNTAGGSPLSLDLRASRAQPLPSSGGPGLFVRDNQTSSDWFIGSDFTQAFGATALFPGGSVAGATYPTGVAIATLLAGGYNASAHVNLPPFDPVAVSAYFNATFPASWPQPAVAGVPVTFGSLTPPLPGPNDGLNDSTLDQVENSLDVEMAGSLAPGASIDNFYFAGSLLQNAAASSIASYFAQTLSEALAYNYSPERLAVVSGSFGLPDLNNSLWNTELLEAATEGVTVTVASGDQGNAPNRLTHRGVGPWPTWPATAASNASGAIAVGGVSLALGGTPTGYFNGHSVNLSYDASISGIDAMSAWYDAPPGASTVAGTEGGASTVTPEPYWQFHSAAQPAIVSATVLQGASALGRTEPDVALPANDTIATVSQNSTGTIFFAVLEGTSIAAPVFAGLLADVVAVESAQSVSGWAPLGFFAPEVYRIASFYAANPDPATDPFSDVVTGHNYVFKASVGWDATTGWGVVRAPLLLSADQNASVADYVYAGPTPLLPPPSSTPTLTAAELALIFLAAVVATVLVVVFMLRPKRGAGPVAVPPGAHGMGPTPFAPGVPGGSYPGATFLCPYCGAVRPAEPVRCPQCGAL